MERQKFRNHFSIVFENMGAFLWIIILCFISGMDEFVAELVTWDVEIIPILVGIGIFLLVVGLIMGWQFWVWSKTWIILDDSSITVEKNTFTLNKNTVGLKNISNVNVEQNLFEMFMGTSKVKINTNSFSTANTTDIKIVIKKKDAENLKQVLLQQMEILNGNEVNVSAEEHREIKKYDVKASAKDIILNSIYSINVLGTIIGAIFSTTVIIAYIIGFVVIISGENQIEKILAEKLTLGAAIIIAIVIMVIMAVLKGIKSYFKLYGFSAYRDMDKIYIKYGLFKQFDYAVPVDKINAVIIHQTLLARMLHKYSVEIVNVGMGDDKEENTLVCLYASKEKVLNAMATLIPEFKDAVNTKAEKQPKAVWIIYGIKIFIMLLFLCFIGFVAVCIDVPILVATCIVGAIALLGIISHILEFLTSGISVSDEYLGIKEGAYATKYTITKIEKIQYLTVNTNALTNKLGMVKGRINILAMTLKSIQILPYFKKEKVNDIKKVLLKN